MSLKSLARKVITSIRDDFNLDEVKSEQFFKSQWELLQTPEDPGNAGTRRPHVSTTYLIYRGFYMLILVSSITFSTTCQSHLFHLFLTNWSFSSQNLYAILFFISVLYRWWSLREQQGDDSKDVQRVAETERRDNLLSLHYASDNHKQKNPKNLKDKEDVVVVPINDSPSEERAGQIALKLTYLEKFIWLLLNITHVLPYIVVLGYWIIVYKYDPDQPACEKFRSHYIVHGATAFLAFFDMMIIAIPVRKAHFLIPTGLVLLYVLFTGIHEALGGSYRPGKTFIYSVLDWKERPKKAVFFSTLAVFLMPFAHILFCWGLYKLRTCITSCFITQKRNRKINKNPPK